MELFDVYSVFPVNIVRGKGCEVYDEKGQAYLDLYGGHAVISVGHSHPYLVKCMSEQLQHMGHRTKRFFQWSGKMGERF